MGLVETRSGRGVDAGVSAPELHLRRPARGRFTPMKTSITLTATIALLAACAVEAAAGQYPGRSDTGWVDAGKRECCNEAIALAQRESATLCRNVGGTPSPMRGGVQRRGTCQWESAVHDDG